MVKNAGKLEANHTDLSIKWLSRESTVKKYESLESDDTSKVRRPADSVLMIGLWDDFQLWTTWKWLSSAVRIKTKIVFVKINLLVAGSWQVYTKLQSINLT